MTDILYNLLLFLLGVLFNYWAGISISLTFWSRKHSNYLFIVMPTLGYVLVSGLLFIISAVFNLRLPVSSTIVLYIVFFLNLAAIIFNYQFIIKNYRIHFKNLILSFALALPLVLLMLWPLIYVGFDTYLASVNPDWFASFAENYYLQNISVLDNRSNPDELSPFYSSQSTLRFSAKFASALYSFPLSQIFKIELRASLALSIALFLYSLPLSTFLYCRLVLGLNTKISALSSSMIGFSSCIGMSLLYNYVGQNSALAIAPLIITILFLSYTNEPDWRMQSLSAIVMSFFVYIYFGMLPFALGPVGLTILILLIRKKIDFINFFRTSSIILILILLINVSMFRFLKVSFTQWSNLIGASLQGQYFTEFITEMFFSIFFGILPYPVSDSVLSFFTGYVDDIILIGTVLSFLFLSFLLYFSYRLFKELKMEASKVFFLSASILYCYAFFSYSIVNKYGYAAFKLSSWMQFYLVPIIAFMLYRIFYDFKKATNLYSKVLFFFVFIFLFSLGVLSNLVNVTSYSYISLGHLNTRAIVNAWNVTGNKDFLQLEKNISNYVKKDDGIGIAFENSILQNWVGYYLRDYKSSLLGHDVMPGDDENLPNPETSRVTDYYGNNFIDKPRYFNGASDNYYLTWNKNFLHQEITNQEHLLSNPIYEDNSFRLFKAVDTKDFIFLGRGFYRLENKPRENKNFYMPTKYRWTAEGGQIYLLRPSELNKPYYLLTTFIVGDATNEPFRDVDFYVNKKKLQTRRVDGTARIKFGPFYLSEEVNMLTFITRNTNRSIPRKVLLWNKEVSSDYRSLNLNVSNIEVLPPKDLKLRYVKNVYSDFIEIAQNAFTFNGFTQDGWVRKNSEVELFFSENVNFIKINIMSPGISSIKYPRKVNFSLNDEIFNYIIEKPGNFSVILPNRKKNSPTKITFFCADDFSINEEKKYSLRDDRVLFFLQSIEGM